MTDAGQKYIVAAQKAAELAQTKYKSVKIEKPWPEWDIAREEALQQFIKFLKGN